MDYLYNPDLWSNLVSFENGMSLLEKLLRTLLVYAGVVFLVRLFGNREVSQINPTDLIVILLLSESIQNAIIGDDTTVVGGLVGALALLAINRLVNVLKFRFKAVERVVEGPSLTLVKNGRLQDDVLTANRITRDDLLVMAHENGIDDVDDIEECILDPNGTIMVEGKGLLKDETFRHDVLAQLKAIQERLDALAPPPVSPSPVPPPKLDG